MPRTINDYNVALDTMYRNHYFYDNRVPQRCEPWWHGRDCATSVAFGLHDAGYDNVNLCDNSFGFAELCFNTPRPQWVIDKFGGNFPGTFITYEQAQTIQCVGLRGNNWGREEDDTGDGHIETVFGKGKLTFGFHSHASGCGYDVNGLDNHSLSSFAILPWWLNELGLMYGQDPAIIAALKAMDDWRKSVWEKPILFGEQSGRVAVLVGFLVHLHFLHKDVHGNKFGDTLAEGVYKLKLALGNNGNTKGDRLYGPAADSLLHLLGS